jgi:hypothetical protein
MEPPRTPDNVHYACPEEWEPFARRHIEFVQRFENLERAIDVTFKRVRPTSTLLERTIYFLGRIVVEEFMEILLFCGNGYGVGAQKILRGMYERAVTSRYLYKHPEELDNYLAFHKITDYKILRAIEDSMGGIFSKEEAEKIRQEFEAEKARFTITDCKKCKTTRLNHTWSKVDVVSMARMNEDLWSLVVPAYYMPTRESHSTLSAICSRLDVEPTETGGGLLFDGAPQRDRADHTLVTAHSILLNALDLQKECFGIAELEPVLQLCFDDFLAIVKSHQEETTEEQAND